MEYQLVLQFPEEAIELEGLVELEERIRSRLGPGGRVDGHDIGSGEANIFIYTTIPLEAFQTIKGIMSGDHLTALKAAYRNRPRPTERSQFTVLWPAGESEFKVT